MADATIGPDQARFNARPCPTHSAVMLAEQMACPLCAQEARQATYRVQWVKAAATLAEARRRFPDRFAGAWRCDVPACANTGHCANPGACHLASTLAENRALLEAAD